MTNTEYIQIAKLNKTLFKQINIPLLTDEVILTYEKLHHITDRRRELFKQIKDMLPDVIYQPDYIYQDWNDRDNTVVLVKMVGYKMYLNVVIKIAILYDKKHTKNSIITIIKIGEKTFNKIMKNKNNYLLIKNIDKCE